MVMGNCSTAAADSSASGMICCSASSPLSSLGMMFCTMSSCLRSATSAPAYEDDVVAPLSDLTTALCCSKLSSLLIPGAAEESSTDTPLE